MNEKIKSLIAQAGTVMVTDGCHEPTPVFDKERFAELLIKECSQLAVNCHPHDLPFLGGAILTHFGIDQWRPS